MWRRLLPLSWAEWRHHPWRHAAALLAVALGVALAASVQIINASALGEFAQAVRAVNGAPDLVLAAAQPAGFDDALFGRIAADPALAVASPVVEVDTSARALPPPGASAANGEGGATGAASAPSAAAVEPAAGTRVAVKVAGVDALVVARIAPGLLPRPAAADGNDRSGAAPERDLAALLAPDRAYLNPAALARLGVAAGDRIALRSIDGEQVFSVAGQVAAGGAPLVVVDIAAAQQRFGRLGRLSRIDLRLQPGIDRNAWRDAQRLGPGVRWAAADEAVERMSNLSRAYRVNLGVLALVALLVGGFLVYSVVSLSVAQRTPQLALLGVLGLDAASRRRWLLAESVAVGVAGSALGLALGAGLAALALQLLGGDLGGGFFAGVAPTLRWPLPELAACALLGVAATVGGAWWPARQAERLAPAQALKGLGSTDSGTGAPVWPGLALLAGGAALALAPAIAGLALAAYASVALLLAGGVALVPAAVGALLAGWRAPRHALWLLALRRAHHARRTASATVSGVVASLALAVAITVMVSSFRSAVADWLDAVLPADLYARTAANAAAAEQVRLAPELFAAAARLPGVRRVQAGLIRSIHLRPGQPALTLLARPLGDDPARSLPLLGHALPRARLAADELAVYASEPAAAIYHFQVGQRLHLPLRADGTAQAVRVAGIWRDYARQFGALAVDSSDYRRATGDARLNDLQLWLAPGASAAAVSAALAALEHANPPLEMVTSAELRRTSLAIFDRSFAVTVYLQAVAIGVGLVGVAASLSAQVLARRKEFGLLAHLGLTRRQVTRLVALETAAWLLAGVVIGVALGLAMAVVLVHVVNPQSFHWSMPLSVPLARLTALAGAVLAAGGVTALLAARHAAAAPAVQAVKEDW